MNDEKEMSLEPRSQVYYNNLADKLDELQQVQNKGMGDPCVQAIIFQLRKGNIEAAKSKARIDSDKLNDVPGDNALVQKILIEELFDDEEEHPWSLIHK